MAKKNKQVVTSGVCPICGSDDFVWDGDDVAWDPNGPNESYGILHGKMISGDNGTFKFTYKCYQCNHVGVEVYRYNLEQVKTYDMDNYMKETVFKAGDVVTVKKVKAK